MKQKPRFNFFNLDQLIDTLLRYIDVRTELIKLQLKESLIELMSALVYVFILVAFVLSFLFFTAISVGQWLNTIFESAYLGYVAISFIYLIIVVILIVKHKGIIRSRIFESVFRVIFELDDDQ